MATKRTTLRRGLRVPVVAPRKKPTKKAPVRAPRPTTKRVSNPSVKQRTDRVIAAIADRLERVDTEYYEIGQALTQLDDPTIWRVYGETTFRNFLQEHVIPYSTARRMLTVAQSYTKAIAKAIGLERGYQLARLARLDPKIKRAANEPSSSAPPSSNASPERRFFKMPRSDSPKPPVPSEQPSTISKKTGPKPSTWTPTSTST